MDAGRFRAASRRISAALVLMAASGAAASVPSSLAANEAATAHAPPDSALYPILVRGRWGFVDRSGRVAIPPRFRSTFAAEEEGASGRAGGRHAPADFFMAEAIGPEITPIVAVALDHEWRFVDRHGAILPRRFDEVGAFREGMAPIRLGTQWGFVDGAGRIAVPPRFDGVGPFQGGVAIVNLGPRYGVIDTEGRFVVQPRFESIRAADSVFHDNRALFTLFGKKGYVSRAGTIAVPPAYDDASPFAEGLAAVTRGSRTAYIDTSGRIAVAFRDWTAGRFSCGRAVVVLNGKYGYIDRSGDYIAPPQFSEAHDFSASGQALAWMGSRRGEVDLSGRWSETPFEEIQRLDDEHSVGIVAGRAGLVRRATGEMLREYSGDGLGPFSEGLARVRGDGSRFGFIDREGRAVIPVRFQQAGHFDRGLCKAVAGDTLGYIDRSGAWVWSSRRR